MFFAGDEFLNSQYGNNNAYCQDNEISWLDWEDKEKNREHFAFCKYMIAFRKLHPVLRKNMGQSRLMLSEITVQGADENTKILRIIYAGQKETEKTDDIVCLAINVYWEEQEFTLLPLQSGESWHVAADTGGVYLPAGIPEHGMVKLSEPVVRMAPRSVCVLVNGK
jgi:glycogen operon protein